MDAGPPQKPTGRQLTVAYGAIHFLRPAKASRPRPIKFSVGGLCPREYLFPAGKDRNDDQSTDQTGENFSDQ